MTLYWRFKTVAKCFSVNRYFSCGFCCHNTTWSRLQLENLQYWIDQRPSLNNWSVSYVICFWQRTFIIESMEILRKDKGENENNLFDMRTISLMTELSDGRKNSKIFNCFRESLKVVTTEQMTYDRDLIYPKCSEQWVRSSFKRETQRLQRKRRGFVISKGNSVISSCVLVFYQAKHVAYL